MTAKEALTKKWQDTVSVSKKCGKSQQATYSSLRRSMKISGHGIEKRTVLAPTQYFSKRIICEWRVS